VGVVPAAVFVKLTWIVAYLMMTGQGTYDPTAFSTTPEPYLATGEGTTT
jgi:hypothetical protein